MTGRAVDPTHAARDPLRRRPGDAEAVTRVAGTRRDLSTGWWGSVVAEEGLEPPTQGL
jgi:hypothetical protein